MWYPYCSSQLCSHRTPSYLTKDSRTTLQLILKWEHLAYALDLAAWCHQLRREGQRAKEQAQAGIALSTEYGLPLFLAQGTIYRGWALTEQGQEAEGVAQIQQGMTAFRATGAGAWWPSYLALLAQAYGKDGKAKEGLTLVAEALAFANKTGELIHEAELYRLKGTLTLQSQVESHKSKVEEAEGYFQKAIKIAQQQQAKSLELRASTSLARLWQQQGKRHEAHTLLAEVYNWFTEGFDTKDLQEAKALLGELS